MIEMSPESLTIITWLTDEARKAGLNPIELLKFMIRDLMTDADRLMLDLIWANICIRHGGKEIPDAYIENVKRELSAKSEPEIEVIKQQIEVAPVYEKQVSIPRRQRTVVQWTTEMEQAVAFGTLAGKSLVEISRELGVPTTAVYSKVKSLKKRK